VSSVNEEQAKKKMLEEEKVFREKILEKELRKQKEAYTKARMDQMKEHERDSLDSKS